MTLSHGLNLLDVAMIVGLIVAPSFHVYFTVKSWTAGGLFATKSKVVVTSVCIVISVAMLVLLGFCLSQYGSCNAAAHWRLFAVFGIFVESLLFLYY